MQGRQDFLYVHDLFLRISEELAGGAIPVPVEVQAIRSGPNEPTDRSVRWLWLLDSSIAAERLRRTLEQQPLDAEGIHALVRYFAGKKPLTESDSERLEWLATRAFRGRAAGGTEMLHEIQAWLQNFTRDPISGTAEALLAELVEVLEDIVACGSFRELSHSDLLTRGRRIKQRFRDEFVHPQVLAAVVNYNLVSGHKFQQLLATAAGSLAAVPPELAARDYRAAAEEFRTWQAVPAQSGSAQQGGPPAQRAGVPAPPTGIRSPGPAGPVGPAEPAEPLTGSHLARRIAALGIDPNMEEGRLRSLMSELVAFARAAGRAIADFPLPNSVLHLAPHEVQSLLVEYPGTEHSFRANFNRVVRRAAALLAMAQEEGHLLEMRRHSEHYWKKHLDTLFYTLYAGEHNVAELELLLQDAASRGLVEKGDQLTQTLASVRLAMQRVMGLCAQWNQPGSFPSYA